MVNAWLIFVFYFVALKHICYRSYICYQENQLTVTYNPARGVNSFDGLNKN